MYHNKKKYNQISDYNPGIKERPINDVEVSFLNVLESYEFIITIRV